MKKLMIKAMSISFLVMSTTSAGAFSSCEFSLQNKIDSLNAKIQGLSLAKYLAFGAGAGGIGGTAVSLRETQKRNNYVDGYNAGAAGYQTGYNGQTGASYLEGYQTARDGQSSVPKQPNYVTNIAIGAGAGAGIGAGVFFVKKSVLKRELNNYQALLSAFQEPMNNEVMLQAAKMLMPKKLVKNLDDLRTHLLTYENAYCDTPGIEVSLKKIKKFVKNQY